MSAQQWLIEAAHELAQEGKRALAADLLRDVRRMRSRERLIESILAETNGHPVGVELACKGERYVLICEEPDGTGKGRLVRFDPDGLSGHSVYVSPVEALSEAVLQGYVERADGTLDRLSQTPRWQIGMRFAELAAQFNAGRITAEELREQARALEG